jgi:hypothetical protein
MTLNAVPVKRPTFQNRGIQSETLLAQVESTAPFLFEATPEMTNGAYFNILREARAGGSSRLQEIDQDLWSYFDLCLASHFATVGTFVPTDVDLAIREKLWNFVHHTQAWTPMWHRVREFLTWDDQRVSARVVIAPSGAKLSGHQGEWFTVAMAAYGSAKKVSSSHVAEVREAIEEEHVRQAAALEELEKIFLEEGSIDAAKAYAGAVAAVVHNLGDLDRMFEAWGVDDQDVLKRRVFRSGHEDARNPVPALIRAGQIYQKFLASENHRHFALREPKALRRSRDFLLPYGPWLDGWGRVLVRDGFKRDRMNERELRDVVVALVSGWKNLNPKSIYTSIGYARALAGVATELGDGKLAAGRLELEALVPPIVRRELVEGGLRTLLSVTQEQFEKEFSRKLLSQLATLVED